jgi:hypothetical protein
LKAELASSKDQLAASQAECDSSRADSALLKDILQSNCKSQASPNLGPPQTDMIKGTSQHTKYGMVAGTRYRFWCGRCKQAEKRPHFIYGSMANREYSP